MLSSRKIILEGKRALNLGSAAVFRKLGQKEIFLFFLIYISS